MADSDGDYVADDASDDDFRDHQVTSTTNPHGTRSKNNNNRVVGGAAAASSSRTSASRGKSGRKNARAAWEDVKRSWDTVVEGADGNLAVAEGLEAEKRRRLLRDTTPLQRGIIRHLVLVLDMSFAMGEKDLLPSRHHKTIGFAHEFVREYFEQNPISQMAVMAMRDGVAVRVSDMSGNQADHVEKLAEWVAREPQGNPSLQNALEMCRGALFHTPSHGTREVLVVYGALLSSDPGDIHQTISSLVTDRIRVTIVGLAAQVAICAEICSRTNAGDDSQYRVAQDEVHYRQLLLAATTPPVTRAAEHSTASLLRMGFPSQALAPGDAVAYCACHNSLVRSGYLCTRCGTRVCRLPAECPACGLTLILSTHLARSYHHLFPLRNWIEVSWADAATSIACFSCLAPFPWRPKKASKSEAQTMAAAKSSSAAVQVTATMQPRPQAPTKLEGVSESGRYACQVCGNHFCIDCDVYAHEVLHNCPGCQSGPQGAAADSTAASAATITGQDQEPHAGNVVNGHRNGGDHMVID